MDIRYIAQTINLILALLAIIPSIKLLKVFIRDKKIINDGKKQLNRILVMLFGGVSLTVILNAIVAFLVVFDYGTFAHNISPYTRGFINLFLLFVSWSLYKFHKHANGD